MPANKWLGILDSKCDAVVNAFKDMYSQVDTLDDVPDLTPVKLEEINAIVQVKVKRMIQQIGATAIA